MARSRTDQGIFEISLPAVVDALNKVYPLPLVWAEDAGSLYRKAREIHESPNRPDMNEDAVVRRYLAEGYTDGEVMALASILEAMGTGDRGTA